jgi:hypothetical protein
LNHPRTITIIDFGLNLIQVFSTLSTMSRSSQSAREIARNQELLQQTSHLPKWQQYALRSIVWAKPRQYQILTLAFCLCTFSAIGRQLSNQRANDIEFQSLEATRDWMIRRRQSAHSELKELHQKAANVRSINQSIDKQHHITIASTFAADDDAIQQEIDSAIQKSTSNSSANQASNSNSIASMSSILSWFSFNSKQKSTDQHRHKVISNAQDSSAISASALQSLSHHVPQSPDDVDQIRQITSLARQVQRCNSSFLGEFDAELASAISIDASHRHADASLHHQLKQQEPHPFIQSSPQPIPQSSSSTHNYNY